MASPLNPKGTWYKICFLGHLDQKRVSDLEKLTITYQPGGETELCALIPDQAALFGILNRLQALGIPLISVNQISHPDPSRH